MALTRAQSIVILKRLGWRVDTTAQYNQALKDFQAGWNLGPELEVDGILGKNTADALVLSESRRAKGLTTASKYFSFSEFACKCGGKYSACRRIWIQRKTLAALEVSRAKLGRPISVTSGCRCVGHNNAVGGAKNSQHLYGLAVDWRGPDKDITRGWRVWSGIGYGGKSDVSLHTDMRPNATPAAPTTWVYATS